MRILIFIVWLTLGILYFFIWSMKDDCCSISGNTNQPIPEIVVPAPLPNTSTTNSSTAATTPLSSAGEVKNNISANPIDTQSRKASPPIVIGQGCIKFDWGQSDPITAPCFDQWRDSLIKTVKAGQVLELIGGYFEKENRIMASADLGLIRASKLKNLFGTGISGDQIKIRSKNLGDTTGRLQVFTNPIFTRTVFMNDQIKELDDKTIIYFKFASNAGTNDALVNQYISHLAASLKNSSENLVITGHTDDDATAEHNLKLGLRRAELIKSMLVAKGIKSSRIKTASKGEEQPIAPNDIEENRKLNRRVEVVITPAQ